MPVSPHLRLSGVLLAAILAVTLASPPSAGQGGASRYTITDLGILQSQNGNASFAYGINNVGQVVGQATINNGFATRPFFWEKGTMVGVNALGGSSGQANRINENGRVVGTASDRDGHTFAVVGSRTSMGTFGVPGPSNGSDINDQGHVVGTVRERAFFWAGSGPIKDLGTLREDDSGLSYGLGMNNRGEVVGGASFGDRNTQGRHAFLFTIDASGNVLSKADLGTLGGSQSWATEVNDQEVVVGYADTNADPQLNTVHAFMSSGGGLTDLGTLGGPHSAAFGLNEDGQIVGQARLATPPGVTDVVHACLWEGGAPIDLNTQIPADAGWELFAATDVNDAGQIVGFGHGPGDPNNTHGFLLTPAVSAPELLLPRASAIVSPTTTFKARVTDADGDRVRMRVEVRAADQSTVTFESDLVDSGEEAEFKVRDNQGLHGGTYEWRARAIDEDGNEGPWSDSRFFTVFGGIDLAFDEPAQTWWNQARAGGWSFFIANGWTGRRRPPPCERNLGRARLAGLFTAAYCFLNFDNGSTIPGAPANQDGGWQARQAILAAGAQKNNLRFMAIDVEEGWAGTMTPGQRIQRICEAVAETRRAGLRPIIYTKNSQVDPQWNNLTGGSTEFSHLPLWVSRASFDTDDSRDDLELDAGQVWTPFGGWTTRVGKQFAISDTGTRLFNVAVDLNTFDPALFAGKMPAPPGKPQLELAATAEREGDEIVVTAILENQGDAMAECVTLTLAKLGRKRTTTPLPLSLLNLAPGQAKQAALAFPGSAGGPGSARTLNVQVRMAGGRARLRAQVTLP